MGPVTAFTKERAAFAHRDGTCYQLNCACRRDQRSPQPQAQRVRAYAYLRAHLLVCTSEVNRTKERLTQFAASSDFELAATFVEQDVRSPATFGRMLDAAIRDEVEVVLLPSMLHLMALGSPRNIRAYF